LACGASLVWLATDQAGHPVAVSDRTPNIPTSIRRAVRARDQGCVFPTGNGSRCGLAPPYCDVHHVVYRSDGGRHTVDNCRMLCRFHHHLVHEGGFGLSVADDGTLQARRPDGSPLPNRPPPPPDPDGVPPPPHLDLETDIAWARSNGERMELATTVDVLLYGIGLKTSWPSRLGDEQALAMESWPDLWLSGGFDRRQPVDASQ
jgi:hypothetical protein